MRRGFPTKQRGLTTRGCFAFSLLLCVSWLELIECSSTSRGSSSSSFYGEPPRGDPTGDDEDNYYVPPENDFIPNQEDGDSWNQNVDSFATNQRRPPPPVRPPPPPRGAVCAVASTTGTSNNAYVPPPIHYPFQSKDSKRPPPSSSGLSGNPRRRGRRPVAAADGFVDDDGVPLTSLADDYNRGNLMRQPSGQGEEADEAPAFASARRDVITLFMERSIWNRWILRLAAGTVGAVTLTFVGTSTTTKSWWSVYAWTGFWLFLVTSWFRTPYGELCRTSGFLLLQTLRESRQIRREYPTRPHLRALLGAGPRRPFPPTENPWNYRPSSPDDIAFSMVYALMAMTVVGSFCGGNIPMVPSWMGALAGAGFLGLLTTRPNARGDLARATGMRVVATVQTLWDLQRDLGMSPKFWKVASLLLDKLLILDRQHRIKDRLVAFLSFVYDQIMRLVQQVQQHQEEPPNLSRRGGPDPRGRRPPPANNNDRGMGRPPPRKTRDHDDDDVYDWRPPRGGPRRPRPPTRNGYPYANDGDSYLDDDNNDDYYQRSDAEDGDYLDGLDPPPVQTENKRRKGFFSFK